MANKNEWCIIHYGGSDSLVTIDNQDRNKFYWFGSSSWCTMDSGDNTHIVKSYGFIDEMDEVTIESIEKDFYKNYNVPESFVQQSAGWLAPDGKFFPCLYYEHDSFARHLAVIYYDTLGSNATRVLELNNWIRIYDNGHTGVADYGSFVPTKKQMKTMEDIITSFCRDEEYCNTLKENLEWFLENIT